MRKRRPVQRVLFWIAILSYAAAVTCGAAAFYLGVDSSDPVVAALMASVVFFAGVSIVLHVIANTDLLNLKVGE